MAHKRKPVTTWADEQLPGPKTYERRAPGEQRGLYLRVEPSGTRTWYLRYRKLGGGFVHFKLGDAATLDQSEAAGEAHAALKRFALGDDLQAGRRAARAAEAESRRLRAIGETVAEVVKGWLADRVTGPAGRWKGGDEGGSARSFLPHVRAFEREHGARRIADITPQQVARFVRAGDAPVTRNRRLQAVRYLIAWAMDPERGLITADPSAGLKKEHEPPRDRVLSDDELRGLILGFDRTRFGPIVRLLAYTAVRRGEALAAEWSWLDLEAGVMTIPPDVEKAGKARGGEPRRVALSPQAVAVLKAQRERTLAEGLRASPFVFPTQSGAMPGPDSLKPTVNVLRGRRANGKPPSTNARAPKRTAVIGDDVEVHDVRRTIGHRLTYDFGVDQTTVDAAILGHVRPKVVRTYAPLLPLGPAREALTLWADALDAILAATPAAAAQ